MLDTATAVYEAVEPIVVWRAMFASLADPNQVTPKTSVGNTAYKVG